MVLEAILLRSHQVSTFVLSHLDLPLPGGPSGPGVNVNVDLVAGVGGGDPHVLASVVATDHWWSRIAWTIQQTEIVLVISYYTINLMSLPQPKVQIMI